MPRYMARLCLSNTFAQEHMSELGSFWSKYLEMLSSVMEVTMPMYRFTFATFLLEAETRKDGEEQLRHTWQETFNDCDAIAEIMILECPEKDAEDGEEKEDDEFSLLQSVYNSYYGVNEYQRLITDLTVSMPLLRTRSSVDVLRAQNYLFAIDSGYGFTTLISSLGDYLHRMKVYEEEGKGVRESYYEVVIGEETENGFFSQDDLTGVLYEVEKDKNPYNIIGLDVSYFLEGKKYDELRKFLRRLERYQDQFVFAFRIPFLEKRAMDEIMDLFSDLMLVRCIQVPPFADPVLMEAAWNILNGKGFELDTSLLDLIIEKIHREKMDGRFYGFRTVDKIACEIIMQKALDYSTRLSDGEDPDPQEIKAEDVASVLGTKKVQKTGYDALEEMIGMEEITGKVRELVAQVKVSIENEKLDRPCIHMRFTGAPGTGKTTVARIIGQIMREEGILRKGGFFEYTGRDLVAEYVGQTAVKTSRICRDSYGSVLFIDEAYALYDSDHQQNDFGKEALTTLISEMENHRDDMLVVMAGYTDEMDTLMTANPGLRSRMPHVLHFPNYTKEQLFRIFMQMVEKHFEYKQELEAQAKEFFENLSVDYMESKEFANARFVRNLYERTWSKAALRASLDGVRDIVLTKEDFIAASGEKEFSEKIERRKILGF